MGNEENRETRVEALSVSRFVVGFALLTRGQYTLLSQISLLLMLASAYLSLGVRPGGGNNADGEQDYSNYLYARVFFTPYPPSNHRSYAASRPENDVDRYGNIVAKSVVVERIDAEEEYNVDEPALQWNFVRANEEGGSCLVELRNIARDSHEEELDKGQEGTAGGFHPI